MEITGDTMIMGSRRYGARFGTAVANVGDLNMDGYEGKQWSYKGCLRDCYHCHLCLSQYFLTAQCLFFTMLTHSSALENTYKEEKIRHYENPIPYPCTCTNKIYINQLLSPHDY
jgi:hypothetical protein